MSAVISITVEGQSHRNHEDIFVSLHTISMRYTSSIQQSRGVPQSDTASLSSLPSAMDFSNIFCEYARRNRECLSTQVGAGKYSSHRETAWGEVSNVSMFELCEDCFHPFWRANLASSSLRCPTCPRKSMRLR